MRKSRRDFAGPVGTTTCKGKPFPEFEDLLGAKVAQPFGLKGRSRKAVWQMQNCLESYAWVSRARPALMEVAAAFLSAGWR